MLASPLYPSQPFSAQLTSDDHSQTRPTKDIDAFNSLLPPPIEFIEGSSTGTLAIAEDKYEPINSSPKANKTLPATHATPQKTPQSSASSSTKRQLYNGVLDFTWPTGCTIGNGLHNTGNTCFLNSALQCLLHTPPLLRVLHAHSQSDPCRVKNNGFCMACNFRQVMMDSHQKSRSFTPYPITSKLHMIAKHMRRGRQEDSHEFLRYAIDALQKSCLAGYPQNIDHALAETTWVHKIFGGRLRSRVTCRECNYHSDTFDSMLDISLDIHGSSTLKEAFKKFVAVDYLKGADKYKCEKCKKPVVAEKQFTIHDAPAVLTVHLKRFSPLGRKIGHFVHYDERLSLQPVMSEGQYGPMYHLYGIISHAGGGPNSGHYLAHVKAANGRWFEMNDETVSSQHKPPVDMKNAYILFYIRDKGQSLDAAVHSTGSIRSPVSSAKPSIVASMKRRKVADDDEDVGVKVDRPFIGPLLPSPILNSNIRSPLSSKPASDPQAISLHKKIAAATKASNALVSLNQYGDDDDSTDGPTEPRLTDSDTPTDSPTATQPPTSSLPSEATSDTSTASTSANTPPLSGITPSSFYATSTPAHMSHDRQLNKKRKSPDNDTDNDDDDGQRHGHRHNHSRSPHHHPHRRKVFSSRAMNPYSRAAGNNTLFHGQKKYKKRMIM
ncbi:cysteine proteinase [Scleroderma citrinum]